MWGDGTTYIEYMSCTVQHVHVHVHVPEHEGCSISIPASLPCCGAAFDIFVSCRRYAAVSCRWASHSYLAGKAGKALDARSRLAP